MRAHADVIRTLVDDFNQRSPIDIDRVFAPEFSLDQAGTGASRSGLAGARAMTDALYALGHDVRLEILTLVEEGDYVAVRWQLTSNDPAQFRAASMSFYQFVDGLIVRDWGLLVQGGTWER